jgi:hypothetical protein
VDESMKKQYKDISAQQQNMNMQVSEIHKLLASQQQAKE